MLILLLVGRMLLTRSRLVLITLRNRNLCRPMWRLSRTVLRPRTILILHSGCLLPLLVYLVRLLLPVETCLVLFCRSLVILLILLEGRLLLALVS